MELKVSHFQHAFRKKLSKIASFIRNHIQASEIDIMEIVMLSRHVARQIGLFENRYTLSPYSFAALRRMSY